MFEKKDEIEDTLKEELRVVSKVEIHQDQENLNKLILDDNPDTRSKHYKNFKYLLSQIDEWRKTKDADELDKLINTLLKKVVLLPIRCENEDDALTIFQTINDRGQPLEDSDIFKAKLYSAAKEVQKEKEFINRWNALEDHKWLFRVYMHVLRAKNEDIGNEKALRAYFQEEGKNRLRDYNDVMKHLEIYNFIYTKYWEESDEVCAWWRILKAYPNLYWNYPLCVFLDKYGEYSNDEFSI